VRRFAPHRNRQTRSEQQSASTQTKDDQAIAGAFAQQAYTAVGNRDRKIMCDPYLFGFEIVDKNEENNRLVGVFAFRVSGEILMVPVFYLNGKIKGQDQLYRKPVNRF
jgi:delta-aminolevulinic acid dehydratase/porphobilinogen synthase